MTTPENPTRVSVNRGTRVWLIVAAAVAVAVVGAGAFLITRDADRAPRVRNDASGATVTPGAVSSGSCVETYSLETLAQRDVAFAGVVKTVHGDAVTFDVDQWYRGGSGATTTLKGASTLSGVTSAGAATPMAPGTRMLVAGDDGFAWSCGFTQAYTADVASEWTQALKA